MLWEASVRLLSDIAKLEAELFFGKGCRCKIKANCKNQIDRQRDQHQFYGIIQKEGKGASIRYSICDEKSGQ